MKDMRNVKGTKDYFGKEQQRRHTVKEKIRQIFLKYSYQEIETPALEYLEVLEQKDALGEDNVKDVFRIESGEGSTIGLRFDMTTPVSRVVATDKRMQKPIKWFYITNIWRHENTQKGRLREFWQFGVENIGDRLDTLADAENLIIVDEICKEFGIKNYKFKINSRENLLAISEHFKIKKTKEFFNILDKKEKMHKDEWKSRMSTFLDSDSEIDALVNLLDRENDGCSELEKLCFERMNGIVEACVLAGMQKSVIEIDLSLARGLDYYTGFIFEMEVENSDIGSIASGGRYDNLIKNMGGEDTKATGFSGGLERLLEVVAEVTAKRLKKVLIVSDAPELEKYMVCTRKVLFENVSDCCAEIYHILDIKKGLEYADKNNFDYCILMKAEDSSSKEMRCRNMGTHEETRFSDMKDLKNLVV